MIKIVQKKVRQTKGSKTVRKVDKKLKALHPGERVSKTGKTYREYRKNRTDVDRRKKL